MAYKARKAGLVAATLAKQMLRRLNFRRVRRRGFKHEAFGDSAPHQDAVDDAGSFGHEEAATGQARPGQALAPALGRAAATRSASSHASRRWVAIAHAEAQRHITMFRLEGRELAHQLRVLGKIKVFCTGRWGRRGAAVAGR